MTLTNNDVYIVVSLIPIILACVGFLARIDKKISVIQNDVDWLKLKTHERRNNFNTPSNEP